MSKALAFSVFTYSHMCSDQHCKEYGQTATISVKSEKQQQIQKTIHLPVGHK